MSGINLNYAPGGPASSLALNGGAITFGSTGSITLAPAGTTATTISSTLNITPVVNTTGSPNQVLLTAAAHTTLTIAEVTDVNWNLARTVNFAAGGGTIASQRAVRYQAPTYSATTNAVTLTVAATVEITAAPTASTNITNTSLFALNVASSGPTVGNAAATIYGAINVAAHTITLATTTGVTSANGVAAMHLGQVTINQSGGAATVTNAATLDIAGPPIAGASVTLTNLYALRVQSGVTALGGKIGVYNGIVTAGNGVGAIVASGRPAQQTNTTVTITSYANPATDASYEIRVNVNVTTSTTVTMTVTCVYFDETNTSRTLTLPFLLLAGTFVQSITTAQGNIAYESVPITIRVKASTTITLATAGTVTSVVYTAEGRITQVA